MSKQSTAHGRAKKSDNSTPGDTPDAPKIEVLLANVLAKIDEKVEVLRREQSAPTTAGPSSQPDKQPDEGRLAQPVSRHCAARRERSSPSIDRVVNLSDSECTDSDSPAVDIEMRTHGKAKRHVSTSTSCNAASDMGWVLLGDEVTDKFGQRIYSNEYFPLRILRTDYDLDPQSIRPLPP